MASLSISKAWTETAEFLAREARLVTPVALLLVGVPGAASALLIAPGNLNPTAGESLLSMLLNVGTLIAGLIAGIAISHLALRSGASVGESLQIGGRRVGILFLASLLIALPAMVVLFLILMAITPLVMPDGVPVTTATLARRMLPVVILLIFLVLALWAKLALMTPMAAVERVGAVELIRRSWSMTAGNYWRLFGAILLILLVSGFLVTGISFGIGTLLVLISGPPAFGNTTYAVVTIINALLQALVATVMIVFIARVYAQLAANAPLPPGQFR